METQGKRQNYLALNDGYEDEALPGDRFSISEVRPGHLQSITTESIA